MNTSKKKFKRILVANRGEIAVRVIRSAKEMGIETVAVYSDADRNASHVKLADYACHIGKSPSTESYLLGNKIIDVALSLDVDAIHPGYGFLSENAEFAKKVSEAGIEFIGPSPEAIKVMGDKLAAKSAVQAYNIPLVPGTDTAITDINLAKKKAQEAGYPILIKASAGGGGKGMRVVEKEEDFEEQMERAVSEAQSAFGDGSVFIEKYITSPKHIELQVLGDQHGNIVHLFERECSVQRRHQKVIEEAPSKVITEEKRAQMGKDAINVAKACNYFGAGTVEFIMDENLNYYFLEMNTRLQVEHPVTEMITGIDLVKEQIKIAEGSELSFSQEEIEKRGHAIEVRVYAEDPENNFLPDTGTLNIYQRPQGLGVRVDDGYEEGMPIPIFYDPMIAKLIVHAKNRDEAIARMLRAIEEYDISGIKTTLPFCQFVLAHDSFVSGKFTTKFVEKFFTPEVLSQELSEQEYQAASVLIYEYLQKTGASETTNAIQNKAGSSKWKERLK
ncbi:MAG: biotin carboxylase [Thalassobius sp.]|nr:biotin carboxylase [Thalassovita sp.]